MRDSIAYPVHQRAKEITRYELRYQIGVLARHVVDRQFVHNNSQQTPLANLGAILEAIRSHWQLFEWILVVFLVIICGVGFHGISRPKSMVSLPPPPPRDPIPIPSYGTVRVL